MGSCRAGLPGSAGVEGHKGHRVIGTCRWLPVARSLGEQSIADDDIDFESTIAKPDIRAFQLDVTNSAALRDDQELQE